MSGSKTEYKDLTEAQKHALYRSVEAHFRKVGQRVKGVEKEPVRLHSTVAGSTASALDRKGLVTRARDNYYRNYYDLTPEGRRLGVIAFQAYRDDLDPREWAARLKAEKDKEIKATNDRIAAVADRFKGFTVTVNKSRRPLPKVIEERLRHEGPQVKLHERELVQIGEQIQKLVP